MDASAEMIASWLKVLQAATGFLLIPLYTRTTMNRHSRLPHSSGFDRQDLSHRTGLPALDFTTMTLIWYSLLLIFLTAFHARGWDQGWQTESALLVLFASVPAAWFASREIVLIFGFLAGFVWFIIDCLCVPGWWIHFFGYGLRFLLMTFLVLWTSRARRYLDRAQLTARIDSLTGLPNRKSILTGLESEICRSLRFGRTFSIGLLDCDDFKLINTYRIPCCPSQEVRSTPFCIVLKGI